MFDHFPRYEQHHPLIPVWCVTPNEGRTIHRFFDTSPFSPSGRYLAGFRLPQEERSPAPGETGEIVLIDLENGEERVVASTCGWEPQLGANLQWGADDETMLFNDVDIASWTPLCVVLNPFAGKRKTFPGGIYKASPDGKRAAHANLTAMRRTQSGYGVVIPDEQVPRNSGLAENDGLYVLDLETGQDRLLISIKDCVQRANPRSDFNDLIDHEVYGFHCKWNAQGSRLMFSLRAFPASIPRPFNKRTAFDVYTMDNEARDIRLAIPAREWKKRGHHTNWFPDGESLSMNLDIDEEGVMRFVQVRFDGSGLRKILEHAIGSGHPTLHPDGRHILTDAYPYEPVAFGDGTVPLRWIDMKDGTEQTVARMRAETKESNTNPSLRVDPHPAWDPTYRFIAFNGFADGTRRIYVADMSGML